jgi:hypothetical protein
VEPAPRPQFQPGGAGALLAAATVLAGLVGALVGWLAGSTALGILGGVDLGIPLGIFAVYRRYRGYFT